MQNNAAKIIPYSGSCQHAACAAALRKENGGSGGRWRPPHASRGWRNTALTKASLAKKPTQLSAMANEKIGDQPGGLSAGKNYQKPSLKARQY